MLGSGVSMQSLYMLRDNSGAGQLSPGLRRQPPHFTHADMEALSQPPTPGWPMRSRNFAGRPMASSAGAFHIGSLGSIPRIRGLEAGQLNPSAFALAGTGANLVSVGGAPGVGGSPYPSFGPVNPNAPGSPGSPDQPGAKVIGVVPGRAVAPPIQMTPTPTPTTGPAPAPSSPPSNVTPWLVGGGLVLAFLFLGTQDKKKRRRR